MRNDNRNNSQRYRYAGVLLAGIVTLGLLVGCMTGGGFRNGYQGELFQRPSLIPGSFETLWDHRTISLVKVMEGPSLFSSGTTGPRSGFGPFPLTIRATFMDSLLIDQGVAVYADLAGMTEQEARAYRARYRETHHTGKYLYVWAEIYTRYHESYLNLDHWIFFLENESEQQFEPVQIVESSKRQREFFPGMQERWQDFEAGDSMGPGEQPALPESLQGKIVEFYFPRTSFFGNPVVGTNTRSISLVAVNRENLDERAAGTWHFDRF